MRQRPRCFPPLTLLTLKPEGLGLADGASQGISPTSLRTEPWGDAAGGGLVEACLFHMTMVSIDSGLWWGSHTCDGFSCCFRISYSNLKLWRKVFHGQVTLNYYCPLLLAFWRCKLVSMLWSCDPPVPVFQHRHQTRCKLCRFWWVATAGASVDCTGTLAIGHECQAKPTLVAG